MIQQSLRIFLFMVLLGATTTQAAPLVELVARQSADKWLGAVDEGKYGEAWAWCAPFFRTQIERKEFVEKLDQVRTPLGKVESRELMRMFYSTSLPNAPEAHYVVIQYKTKFAGREEPALEVITPMLINPEGDPVPVVDDPSTTKGEWQVSGYFIQ